MRENSAEKRAAVYGGARPFLIFFTFAAGAVLVRLAGDEAVVLDMLKPSLPVYALVFAAVLTLSASILGIALLPICAFAFGGIFGRYAALLMADLQAMGILDLKDLLLSAAAIPAFFLLTVRGMYTSEMLGSMLDRSSASARADYNREYIPMSAAALAVLAAGYFLEQMRF